MELWQALVLGIVEGITEFLPISSTGHLVVVEKLMGLPVNDPAMIAFTAVIQSGAIAAVLVYFAKDIFRLTVGWVKGIFVPAARRELEYRLAWYVIIGSLPIVLAGYFGQDLIKGSLWNLWTVAAGMILWSGVMAFAEHAATQVRSERQLNLTDSLVVGVAQCLSLVPGVSRAGATITVGLLRDLDRVTATRLSFFLGIPALVGAGALELGELRGSENVSTAALLVGTVVSFVVAYASIAWLLRFVAKHTLMTFVWYRLGFAAFIIILLLTGTVTAT
ncbi:undecaprenyl-diphosphate phosphatase [Natronosporangium hydrolyticum]|uniref:Undecaprenyl-diphosphatase n=1 Tax=Natronosporangium hydrolyticum TaxID=2811111 RepID=A0A895YER8_9ACTN|nr:undecaprenyl-diphosphate phosphatase [Natronosporangium hydrolyticum]QSB12720.1 undecaprenyl-diphosphate phosphatase [Natronosporangium hydrolyticum]